MNTLIDLIQCAIGEDSRTAFCRKAGISAGNFSRILKGQIPSPAVLRKIAYCAPAVSYEQLMQAAGYTAIPVETESKPAIPVYGSIAAGSPIEAIENFSGTIRLDLPNMQLGQDCFALRVVGNSMDRANIPDGSVVIIRRQEQIRDGEIGAVLVDGQATVKRIYRQGEHIVLAPVSSDPEYSPQIYVNEDAVKVLGKVVFSLVEIE